MSDTSAFGFGKFVPGFDFLQSLSKSATPPSSSGSTLPGMSSWVAPTLSVEELDKRIQELKAVQFWLEQNGTALKATIQALEVQKMTLTTLQGMNVNMNELAKAFTARAPETAVSPVPQPPTTESHVPPTAPVAQTDQKAKRNSKSKARVDQSATGATVDPMHWWGSLTQQFQNIASAAMQDVAAQAMRDKTSSTSTDTQVRPRAKAASRRPAGSKQAPAKKASSLRR